MKKLIAISLLFAASAANAGLFDSLMTGDFPEVKSKAYKVSVYGFDMRVYEWESQTVPDTICIATFSGGDSNGMQVECVKIK